MSSGANLGNAIGVSVSSSGNFIGQAGAGNTIGFNTQQGVMILSGIQNTVSQNLYVGTNGSGTPVQANDIVLLPGANNNQSAPTLLTTYLTGGNLVAEVSGVPPGATVELYQLTTAAPVQRAFLGSGTVTSVSGILTVTIPAGSVANGAQIVATTTVAANGTSAFSAAQTVADLYTVINVNPSGVGSLRQAIINANSHTGSNAITFAITGGSLTIQPTAALPLPAITDTVTINGNTQPGVIIDGNGLTQDGLVLDTGSGGSTIQGLTIERFAGAGIRVRSSSDVIQQNVLGVSGLGNQLGVWIDGGSNSTVGGTTTSLANTIVANTVAGVQINGPVGTANVVEGNFIGVDSALNPLGNQVGVLILNSSGNTVGGSAAGNANTIGSNAQQGVSVGSGIQNVISRNLYVRTNGTGSPTNPPAGDISLGVWCQQQPGISDDPDSVALRHDARPDRLRGTGGCYGRGLPGRLDRDSSKNIPGIRSRHTGGRCADSKRSQRCDRERRHCRSDGDGGRQWHVGLLGFPDSGRPVRGEHHGGLRRGLALPGHHQCERPAGKRLDHFRHSIRVDHLDGQHPAAGDY